MTARAKAITGGVCIEYVANGLGAPSMLLLAWACERRIPATISITGDTGSERDRQLSTGERISARQYFDRVVEPLAREGGIEARFVRAVDGAGVELPPLIDVVRAYAEARKSGTCKLGANLHVPLFGSNGGRMRQSCTDRWKVRAISQELRRFGAAMANGAQGIHYGEVRRVKGEWIEQRAGFDTYKSPNGKGGWSTRRTHYYPFVDHRLNRQQIGEELDRRGIPFLATSECDMCPHQGLSRWERHTSEVIDEIAAVEAQMGGELFFTDLRIPLKDAIAEWKRRRDSQQGLFDEPDFGCASGGLCGV